MSCKFLKHVIEQFESGQETDENITMVSIAASEPRNANDEEKPDEFIESHFYTVVSACKCGANHIFPSDKTVKQQISEMMKDSEVVKCGPYYLNIDQRLEESVLNGKYLVCWNSYQSIEENCEFASVDKKRQCLF